MSLVNLPSLFSFLQRIKSALVFKCNVLLTVVMIIIQDRIDLRWVIQAEMDGGTVEICLARKRDDDKLIFEVLLILLLIGGVIGFVWVPYYSRLTHYII